MRYWAVIAGVVGLTLVYGVLGAAYMPFLGGTLLILLTASGS